MRIWDVEPRLLCRQHLLGEHRELHGLWNILTKHGGVGGYSQHPETRRWVGKLAALRARHEALVAEMTRRGYRHGSNLDGEATGSSVQDEFIDTPTRQLEILRDKPCPCLVPT
jgi:hypothetical protein